MKSTNPISFYALLLIVVMTFSNCKKKEAPAPTKPIKTYIVKFKFDYTNPTATNVANSATILNGTLQYSFSNVNSGHEFSISAKTDDIVSISATNYSTPGYCSVSTAIYLDGSLWQVDVANNNSGSADALAHGVLP